MAKGLRVFGHPLHAALSHLPMGLLGTAPLWDAVGVWRGEAVWWAISYWGVAAGLASTCVAACAGAVDYAAIEEVDPALAARRGGLVGHLLLGRRGAARVGLRRGVRGGRRLRGHRGGRPGTRPGEPPPHVRARRAAALRPGDVREGRARRARGQGGARRPAARRARSIPSVGRRVVRGAPRLPPPCRE